MIKLVKQYKVIALIILLIIVNFLFIFSKKTFFAEDIVSTGLENLSEDKVTISETIAVVTPSQKLSGQKHPVFICGAVKVPGVYYIEESTIINDVLQLAGGFTDEADRKAINLAMSLKGNEKIYIPQVGEQIDKSIISYDNEKDGEGDELGLVNINTADQAALETLPGIGPSKAMQIIQYRESQGTFKSIDELQNVSGIGIKIFNGLSSRITIE